MRSPLQLFTPLILSSFIYFVLLLFYKQHQPIYEEYSEVLCFTSFNTKFTEKFSTQIQAITPSSPKHIIRDPYKYCLLKNACVGNDGTVLVFSDPLLKIPSTPPFTSDRWFIEQVFKFGNFEGPLGSRHHYLQMKTKVVDESFTNYVNWFNATVISDRMMVYSSAGWLQNYYHHVMDALWRIFITLRQVDYIQQLLKGGFKREIIEPSIDISNIPSVLKNKHYVLYYYSHNNAVNDRPFFEKSFPTFIMGDNRNRTAPVCARNMVLQLTFSFYKNIYHDWYRRLQRTATPAPVETKIIFGQYRKFQLEMHGIRPYVDDNKILKVLLVQRKLRSIENIEQLKSALLNHPSVTHAGKPIVEVKIIDNIDYSTTDQLKFYHWASVIITSHGATCTNSIFSRNGTVLFEIETADHREEFYQYSSYLARVRMFTWRTRERYKDTNRIIDLETFIPFLEAAVCFPDFVFGENSIRTDKSKFCKWVQAHKDPSTINYLDKQNPLDAFDKDPTLPEVFYRKVADYNFEIIKPK